MSPATVALTTEDDTNLDAALVVENGTPNLRCTHPNLYRMITATAIISIALALNFLLLAPTFPVYDQPYWLWSIGFFAIGTAKIVFLNFHRNLRLVRVSIAVAIAYYTAFALGTMQPALEGSGSLQLPILYGGLVALLIAQMFEPFINPWTAKRDT